MKKIAIVAGKVLLWIIGFVVFMVVLVYVLIQVPSVQNFAKNKAVNFLENKIKTKVEIDKLSLDLPKLIVLEGVYFEDQKRDTLLAGDTLKVDISLTKLLDHQVEINEIDLRGIRANIGRTLPDSAFNFEYIMKAFVGEQKSKSKPTDTTAGMKFSIEKINLDRINLTFKDAVTSNDVALYLGHFDTRIQKFDLDKMKFEIPKIVLSGVNAKVIQSKPPLKVESTAKVEADSNKPFNLDLKLGSVDLSKIKVKYRNDVSALLSDINLGKLLVEFKSIDLKNQRVNLEKVELSDTKSLIALGKTVQAKIVAKEVTKEVSAQLNNNWKVKVSNIKVENNDLKFDNNNMLVQRSGMDYGHMGITKLLFNAKNFYYSLDTIRGEVEDVSFKDKSGFVLNRLTTNFVYGNQGAVLDKLYLETPRTRITNYISVSYPSLEAVTKHPGLVAIKADLVNSRLGFRDILTFVPTLAGTDPFKRNPNAVLNINGNVSGRLSNLSIPKLEVSGLGSTRISATAKITGLPDMKKANFDITLREFRATSRDINSLVSNGMIPANIRLPENISLKGTFDGGINNFKTNMLLNSTYGSAKASATMKTGAKKGSEAYDANIQLYNFNAGKLIKQEANVGRISGSAKVNGLGTDPKYIRAKFSANVLRAELNKYAYRNLVLNGSIAKQNVVAFAKMNDQNARFHVNAKANIAGTFPSVKMDLTVDSINLQKLKLYNDDLRLRGRIIANMPSTNPDNLIGTVDATKLIIVNKGQRYQVDTIGLVATAQGDQKDIRLKTEFLSANLTGNYKLTEVSNALTNEINKYFKIGDGKRLPVTSNPDFRFALNVVNKPILQSFVPKLTRLDPVNIKGSFSEGNLTLDGAAPKVIFAGNNLDNIRFSVNTKADALNYVFNIDRIGTASLIVNQTTLDGKAQNNKLDVNLNIKDNAKKTKYHVAGLFSALPNQYQFSFNPNGLMLNYENWTVAPDNFLQYGIGGILAHNFQLSRSGQSLTINSEPQQINSPLNVTFANFRIETLTSIASQDSLLAGGTINGNAVVSNVNTSPLFTSDLKVKDFTFRTDTVGDISIQVNNKQANTYAANIGITGKGNDMALTGEYYVQPTASGNFNMDLNIRNINLASVEGLTMGSLKNASGSINGQFKITGTSAVPSIRGALNFNKAAFNVAMLNSYYRIDNEKVDFNSDGIKFNTFTVVDSAGNNAVIDGSVFTTNYRDYKLGLDITTDNFRAVSSTKQDNKLFYGDVYLSSNLHLRGEVASPKVDGSLKINDKTAFTIVIPQSNPGVQEREGIVEFVDFKDPKSLTALTSKLDTLNKSDITGMDVAVNIEVDSNAVFTVIVDEGTGDFLKVQGDAQLTAGIDPSGKVSLTGTYVLSEGAYNLSFNFLKRKFDIQRGSTITWTGDPLSANIDVTAQYTANTAPIDLIQSQSSGTPADLNRYKQKLPFEVALNIKGEMMKPDITFDVSLPTNRNYNVSREVTDLVQTRLTQLKTEPSELNKQVFALLLLGRFVQENPFASSGGGGGINSIARNSVSSILSDQLNKLTENLIQGVDIDFNLVSTDDYTTGAMQNRTDLNVGLSKRLLSDRLKVSIGSNFELEGPRNSNQSSNNLAGNIAVDYQLSKDGRYMLRAYRKNEYQGVVEGYLIETGVGFIVTLDYTKFKEIFARRSAEDRELKRQEKELKKTAKQEEKQVANIEN